MLSMARGFTVNSGFAKPVPRPSIGNCSRSEDRNKKQRATSECRTDLRELNPEYLENFSENPVGSGSYGQCFRARYQNIDVLVKHMIHNNTEKEKERAKKN